MLVRISTRFRLIPPPVGRLTTRRKARFVWANDVRPTLRFFNGKCEKFLLNVNDQYTTPPAVLADPVGDYTDSDAMIYPFKKMIGNQPANPDTRTILVPHLFGGAGGPNAYWGNYDWDLALQDGAHVTGQELRRQF